jgi:hypothetical protein
LWNTLCILLISCFLYTEINKNANLQDLKYAVSDIVKSWVHNSIMSRFKLSLFRHFFLVQQHTLTYGWLCVKILTVTTHIWIISSIFSRWYISIPVIQDTYMYHVILIYRQWGGWSRSLCRKNLVCVHALLSQCKTKS